MTNAAVVYIEPNVNTGWLTQALVDSGEHPGEVTSVVLARDLATFKEEDAAPKPSSP